MLRGHRLLRVGHMERTGGDEVEVVSEADYWVGRVKSIRRFTVRDADVRALNSPLVLGVVACLGLVGDVPVQPVTRLSFIRGQGAIRSLSQGPPLVPDAQDSPEVDHATGLLPHCTRLPPIIPCTRFNGRSCTTFWRPCQRAVSLSAES